VTYARIEVMEFDWLPMVKRPITERAIRALCLPETSRAAELLGRQAVSDLGSGAAIDDGGSGGTASLRPTGFSPAARWRVAEARCRLPPRLGDIASILSRCCWKLRNHDGTRVIESKDAAKLLRALDQRLIELHGEACRE